jgi:hypothetical protein
MEFSVKKVENCFAQAENYEYLIDAEGARFAEMLSGRQASVRVNEGLRRPSFLATLPNGVRVKGLLNKTTVKVGYLPAQAPEQKQDFEQWLSSL